MIYFGPNFFLQLVNGGFDVRVLCVIVQLPESTISLMRSRMAWLIGDLWSLRLYTLRADVSTAFMSLSHKVTLQVPPVRLVCLCLCLCWSGSLSVCCVVSHHLFCQIGNVVQPSVVYIKEKYAKHS